MNSNLCKIFLKCFRVHYGKNLLLNGIPMIYANPGSSIEIGDNVKINSSFLSNLIGLYQRSIIITRSENAKIIIGNNVGISGTTIYARKGIYIGNNTAIGANCKIIDNDFHPIDAQKRIELLQDERGGDYAQYIPTKEIKIGSNCFIGCNVIILKGTILGDGCVVGAGAVVSGKFENDSLIAGNPAKVIRSLKK